MPARHVKLLLTTLFLIVSLLPADPMRAAESCAADGALEFVCGLESPEDLARLPDSHWVIASGRISATAGFLYAVDTRDYSHRILFPGNTSRSEPDRTLFRGCPGPAAGTFQPHGIALLPGTGKQHRLYVVGHGEREAVEVFTVDASGEVPVLTWIGCVIAPNEVRLNSVAPLPGNDANIVVTNFITAGGQLWEWSSSAGWSVVPGSEMPGPNGIVASPDGRWLYIGGWSDQALIRLSRGIIPVEHASVAVGFHIDNVRWAPDGTLLVAGQFGDPNSAIGSCLNGRGGCENVASRVARVNPDTLRVQQLVNYPSNDLLKFGTVALQVGDEIWVGGIAGATRIGRFKP